jgi:hypothetical protein
LTINPRLKPHEQSALPYGQSPPKRRLSVEANFFDLQQLVKRKLELKKVTFFIGLFVALLGGLWLLQGLGIVQMQPILCLANCEPVQGASVAWAIVGVAFLAVGGGMLFWSSKSRAG